MELLKKIFYSKNVWTISFAMFFVWAAFSGLGTLLSSHNPFNKVFLYYLIIVLISFLGATAIVNIIQRVLAVKFPFINLPFDPSWFFVLTLGSIFFSYAVFADSELIVSELFSEVFSLAVIPAGILRTLIISISVLRNMLLGHDKEISILSNPDESKIL
jgi:hypothetical protein